MPASPTKREVVNVNAWDDALDLIEATLAEVGVSAPASSRCSAISSPVALNADFAATTANVPTTPSRDASHADRNASRSPPQKPSLGASSATKVSRIRSGSLRSPVRAPQSHSTARNQHRRQFDSSNQGGAGNCDAAPLPTVPKVGLRRDVPQASANLAMTTLASTPGDEPCVKASCPLDLDQYNGSTSSGTAAMGPPSSIASSAASRSSASDIPSMAMRFVGQADSLPSQDRLLESHPATKEQHHHHDKGSNQRDTNCCDADPSPPSTRAASCLDMPITDENVILNISSLSDLDRSNDSTSPVGRLDCTGTSYREDVGSPHAADKVMTPAADLAPSATKGPKYEALAASARAAEEKVAWLEAESHRNREEITRLRALAEEASAAQISSIHSSSRSPSPVRGVGAHGVMSSCRGVVKDNQPGCDLGTTPRSPSASSTSSAGHGVGERPMSKTFKFTDTSKKLGTCLDAGVARDTASHGGHERSLASMRVATARVDDLEVRARGFWRENSLAITMLDAALALWTGSGGTRGAKLATERASERVAPSDEQAFGAADLEALGGPGDESDTLWVRALFWQEAEIGRLSADNAVRRTQLGLQERLPDLHACPAAQRGLRLLHTTVLQQQELIERLIESPTHPGESAVPSSDNAGSRVPKAGWAWQCPASPSSANNITSMGRRSMSASPWSPSCSPGFHSPSSSALLAVDTSSRASHQEMSPSCGQGGAGDWEDDEDLSDPLDGLRKAFIFGGYTVRSPEAMAELMKYDVSDVVGFLLEDVRRQRLRCKARHAAALEVAQRSWLRGATRRCERLILELGRLRAKIEETHERRQALVIEQRKMIASVALRLRSTAGGAGSGSTNSPTCALPMPTPRPKTCAAGSGTAASPRHALPAATPRPKDVLALSLPWSATGYGVSSKRPAMSSVATSIGGSDERFFDSYSIHRPCRGGKIRLAH